MAASARESPALRRLRQLAREERAAVQAGDVETLCRIAELLPAAMASLQARPANFSPEWSAALKEIQAAQAEAERFLSERMREAALQLEQCGRARRTLQGYRTFGGAAPAALDAAG